MTWCVTSGGDEIRLRSYVNHYVWAHENGVDYRLDLGLGPGLRLPYDAKYAIIRRSLARHDWVMWVDDDVYFTRWSASGVENLMSSAEERDQFLVIADGPVEPTGIWSRINSGVMLLRDDPRTHRLLQLAQAVDVPELVHTWNFERDGLFSGGDQDALWHTLTNHPELMAGVDIVPHEDLNSRPHLVTTNLDAVLNVHFCGPHKQSRIQEFARQRGLGLELVPRDLLDKYSVKVRQEPSWRRYARLRLAREVERARSRVRRKADFVRRERRWK
jgi:hypothetical protein